MSLMIEKLAPSFSTRKCSPCVVVLGCCQPPIHDDSSYYACVGLGPGFQTTLDFIIECRESINPGRSVVLYATLGVRCRRMSRLKLVRPFEVRCRASSA